MRHFLENISTRKAILIIIVVGLIVYSGSLFNGFVWDDQYQIINNLLVHSISNISHFFSGSTFYVQGQSNLQGLYYKPLLTTFYALIYSVFGQNAFFFHFFQLALHIIGSIILFLIFRKFFNSFTSLFITLVFLIHPLNAEAVVYIADLQDILFFFFGILALYLIQLGNQKTKTKAIMFFLLLASLLSKEAGVLFLPLTLVYVTLFKKEKLLFYSFLNGAVFITYLLIRFLMIGIPGNGILKSGFAPIIKATLFERLMTIPAIILYYVKNFFYPSNLFICQQWVVRTAGIESFFLPLFITVLFFLFIHAYGIFLWRSKNINYKVFLFFFSWLILGLAAHVQIIPLDFTVSTRWFYFPIVGLLGLLAVLYNNFVQKKHLNKTFLFLVGILILIGLGFGTISRNLNWRDSLTLFSHDEKVNQSFDLENLLGVELFKVGENDQAMVHFKISTELAPTWSSNWNNLGYIYILKSDLGNAEKSLQTAINNTPMPFKYVSYRDANDFTAYKLMAELLFYNEKDFKRTIGFLNKALIPYPDNAEFWKIKAVAEYKLGNQESAIEAANKLIELSPTSESYAIYFSIENKKKIDIK